ncbi:cardiolipin synthetase 2 [Plasticicumulans acidivorans]|uniref:Cardiolipin synthetase 2 n=1 Tax=Plasticicumulans acidivorans TaxID=886464 RepID=A0A317MR95_9GAMM|nr:cardiolipin synthetase 2 [Plasticicumulans acidivorans]
MLCLSRLPQHPSDGNAVELYVDGDACFETLWADIDAATHTVWVETYILETDAVGCATLARLSAAARRGCDVRLIYDHVGSLGLDSRQLVPLQAAGGRIHPFNPVWPWRASGPWLFRDHRKLVLIDGRIGWVGGRNIGQRYAGPHLGGTPVFRDTQARLRGPASGDLARAFRETLSELRVPLPALPPPAARAGDCRVEVLSANGWRRRRQLQSRVRQAVSAARRRLLLTTPYPLLSRRLLRALRRAARLGVDVQVLIPARSDVRLVDLARARLVRKLARSGVRLHLYGAPMHTKTLVADDDFALVGSFNLDAATGSHNLEIGIAIHAAAVAEQLAQHFATDLEHSVAVAFPLPHSGPWQRLLEWAASRLLRLVLAWPGRWSRGRHP